jgi:hypothetical protein
MKNAWNAEVEVLSKLTPKLDGMFSNQNNLKFSFKEINGNIQLESLASS